MLDSITYQQIDLGDSVAADQVFAALSILQGFEPQPDTSGNVQAVFRLDIDDSGHLVATVPASADAEVIVAAAAGAAAAAAAAAAAYEQAPATAADHAAASAAIITEKLAAVPITRSELTGILQVLLGEATAAISFFETYALDPNMDSEQWSSFQSLDQATKDRLLYDLVRSMAAVQRYLSGNLPTA